MRMCRRGEHFTHCHIKRGECNRLRTNEFIKLNLRNNIFANKSFLLPRQRNIKNKSLQKNFNKQFIKKWDYYLIKIKVVILI